MAAALGGGHSPGAAFRAHRRGDVCGAYQRPNHGADDGFLFASDEEGNRRGGSACACGAHQTRQNIVEAIQPVKSSLSEAVFCSRRRRSGFSNIRIASVASVTDGSALGYHHDASVSKHVTPWLSSPRR